MGGRVIVVIGEDAVLFQEPPHPLSLNSAAHSAGSVANFGSTPDRGGEIARGCWRCGRHLEEVRLNLEILIPFHDCIEFNFLVSGTPVDAPHTCLSFLSAAPNEEIAAERNGGSRYEAGA
jgi:hypothetical protein